MARRASICAASITSAGVAIVLVSVGPERTQTIERAWQMFQDHPVFGIGLGNFREVSRQIYQDAFFRPPHNSFLWAWAEGGIFTLLGYFVLFYLTWRDLAVVVRFAGRDPDVAPIAAALRVVFLLYMFFGLFADLWGLNGSESWQ